MNQLQTYPFDLWTTVSIKFELPYREMSDWSKKLGCKTQLDLTVGQLFAVGLEEGMSDAGWEDENADTEEMQVLTTVGRLASTAFELRVNCWAAAETIIHERFASLAKRSGSVITHDPHLLDPSTLEFDFVSNRAMVRAGCHLPAIPEVWKGNVDLSWGDAEARIQPTFDEPPEPARVPDCYRVWLAHPGVTADPRGSVVALDLNGQRVAYIAAQRPGVAGGIEVTP